MVDLNCRALTRMTQMTLPWMKKGSRIINLASAAAILSAERVCCICCDKSLCSELFKSAWVGTEILRNLCDSCVPGPVDTEFFSVSGELTDPLKKLTLAGAKDVVRKALSDSRRKREISVYGAGMKAARLGAKLMPHSLILKAEELFTK